MGGMMGGMMGGVRRAHASVGPLYRPPPSAPSIGPARTPARPPVRVERAPACGLMPGHPGGRHEQSQPWSPEEVQRLMRLIEDRPQGTPIQWAKLATLVNRSAASLRNFYLRMRKGRQAQADKVARNRCKRCGKIKRGHLCRAPETSDASQRSPKRKDATGAASSLGQLSGSSGDTNANDQAQRVPSSASVPAPSRESLGNGASVKGAIGPISTGHLLTPNVLQPLTLREQKTQLTAHLDRGADPPLTNRQRCKTLATQIVSSEFRGRGSSPSQTEVNGRVRQVMQDLRACRAMCVAWRPRDNIPSVRKLPPKHGCTSQE